ncbi:hypothetical protein [Propionicicella superfundia]|nr:hypothetical protein [Propionicicella superfundia]
MREGHVSRFSKKGTVEDYAVLAFKATRASSEFIALGDDKVEGAKVPGIR